MRSIYRTRIDRALARDIALVCLAVCLVAVSYGAIAVASGFPLWLPMVQSVLVLAGSSELLFVGLVGAGGNPVAVAFAGLLVNARHVPYGLALEPGVTGKGWRRLLGTHSPIPVARRSGSAGWGFWWPGRSGPSSGR
jgi:predicted branched-subunit amino acid permease